MNGSIHTYNYPKNMCTNNNLRKIKKNVLRIMMFSMLIFTFWQYSYANTPITVDWVRYTSYALVSNTQKWSYVFTDFSGALSSRYSTIIVDNWTYEITETITLNKSWMKLIWMNKDASIVIQKNPSKDLLRVYTNNTLVKNLTLDTRKYNAQAAYVIWDWNKNETTNETLAWNYNTLSNCNIYWGNRIFTLYVAGPTYRESIYTKYVNWKLNKWNKIIWNTIEWSYLRDAFVFALQDSWEVSWNSFNWWELDIYMNKKSKIDSNTISNSNKTWIYISWPTDSISITNNKISTTAEHWIKSFYQIDDLPIPETYKYIQNSLIQFNTIKNTKNSWIDLNYTKSSTINWNVIDNTWVHWISLINWSSYNNITNNIVTNFWISKYFRWSWLFITVWSSNNKILWNQFINLAWNMEYAGIFIETFDSLNNDIENNIISGKFEKAWIFSYWNTLITRNNTITNTWLWWDIKILTK